MFIPPKSEVGYLDPEIAGEGQKIIMSDGEQVTYIEPAPKPVVPDLSNIKGLKKYFNRIGYSAWPAWLYHPTEAARLVKNAQEAAQLGICYRDATNDERARFGANKVWDWKEECLWRPQPYERPKFDHTKGETGKNYMPAAPNPVNEQHALVRALVPEVAVAVAKALQANGPSAPANIDPEQWKQFIEFQAWQKSAQAVEEVVKTEEPVEVPSVLNALAETAEEPDREHWLAEADRKGLKVDGRWSTERLKAEVLKVA